MVNLYNHSYAVALLLLKEEYDLDDEQAEQLYEDFYRYLKQEDKLDADTITESMEVGKLCKHRMHGGRYHLRQQLKQNWDEFGDFKIYLQKLKLLMFKNTHLYMASRYMREE